MVGMGRVMTPGSLGGVTVTTMAQNTINVVQSMDNISDFHHAQDSMEK